MAGKFELKKSSDEKYYFNLKAGNGQIILSSQRYASRASAEQGIESVRKNAASDERFDRKTSARDEPYFCLTATNGQNIGQSEMYSSTAAMENGVASVKQNAPDAPLSDLSQT